MFIKHFSLYGNNHDNHKLLTKKKSYKTDDLGFYPKEWYLLDGAISNQIALSNSGDDED